MTGVRRSKPLEELKDPDHKNIRVDIEAHEELVKAQAISVLQGKKKSLSQLIIEKFKIN